MATTSIQTFLDADGLVASRAAAEALRVTTAQLAEIAGISPHTLRKPGRLAAPSAQAKLRDMLEITARVASWAGGFPQAAAWYRATPIPAFGDLTAEQMVKMGHAGAVRRYLDGIAAGGYA